MAVTYKVLGQQTPSAASSTTLYTCPSSTQTVLSCVIVCNRSAVATSFRLGVDVAGAGDDNKDYFAYDVPIEANESISIGHGITMGAADLLRCYATLATLSFSAFGQENT